MDLIIQAAYFVAAVLFIVGLKQMSSPVTARRGVAAWPVQRSSDDKTT